jgi:hypothetical protein
MYSILKQIIEYTLKWVLTIELNGQFEARITVRCTPFAPQSLDGDSPAILSITN